MTNDYAKSISKKFDIIKLGFNAMLNIGLEAVVKTQDTYFAVKDILRSMYDEYNLDMKLNT